MKMVTTKQKGYTLIELMVVVVIISVFSMIMITGFSSIGAKSDVSYGIHGALEQRCIDGYKFLINSNGRMLQVLDEDGKGARCEVKVD